MTTAPTFLACLALAYCLMAIGGAIGWMVPVNHERRTDDG